MKKFVQCFIRKKHDDDMGDEEEDLSLELRANLEASAAITWPEERYAYLKMCYDRTLKKQLDQDDTDFASWVNSVMTHVQTHYRHPSLPTKIQFKVRQMTILIPFCISWR